MRFYSKNALVLPCISGVKETYGYLPSLQNVVPLMLFVFTTDNLLSKTMKKLFYLLIFLYPAFVYAQQPWYKSAPLDYKWQNVGNAGFSSGESDFTSLAFSPSGEPYVAFQDWGKMGKASVMKFIGLNWVYVGSQGFSTDAAYYLSLKFNQSGQAYVAFSGGDVFGTSVMKFDGTEWVYVGSPNFSGQCAAWTSLAFSPSGEPYVAYQERSGCNYPYKASVKKFNGNNWVPVGTEEFSTDIANCPSLAFGTSGQPYVAFCDGGNSYKVTVMTYNGTDWVNVGTAGFSAGFSYFTNLVFSPSGIPYVAFADSPNLQKATVMKYDGTNWVNVGNAGFTDNQADYISLAFSKTGQPYVAFCDDNPNPSQLASVMKFDGTEWSYVGSRGFSTGASAYNSLAFSPSGQPYVAYMNFGVNATKVTVMKYDSVYIGVGELQAQKVSLYPNPATDEITIETPNKSSLSILNIEGQVLLMSQITEPKTQIDISSLPTGVYFVKLISEKGVQTGKLVTK